MRKTLKQFAKYCTVGGIGTLITSYGNLLLQHFGMPEYIELQLGTPIPWALGLAIGAAVTSNFILNKWWTFK